MRKAADAAASVRLAEALKSLRGAFILSLNDVPEVRELFAWASIEEVEVSYSLGVSMAGRANRVSELIISGGGPVA